ncbi:leucine-rich repeat-containing protein 15-like isoform X1 [Onthophagus taurus]|uniref:leucine-rich repeat-containing protein 15-like isoform X1 n=1 Tax=Onthophagus taurus TaxID=166361 RepID=UPI000C205427|nr:leucine-rich repeat-containing protein 15-like [Onthophagus taurus]
MKNFKVIGVFLVISLFKVVSCDVSTFILSNKENIRLEGSLILNTQRIFIFKCSFIEVDENSFKTLTNLTDLTFSENLGVNRLPHKLFEKNIRLENLYLIRNNFSEVENDSFSSLPNLKHLDLSFNKLKELNKDLFQSNVMLMELLLQRNELEHLEEGIFDNLSQLKTIDLAFNKLKKITSNLFKFNYQLETVSLQGNKIKHLDHGIQHLNVKSFNLHSNPLEIENKKVFEIIKSLNSNDVKTGIHLHQHNKNKYEEEHILNSTNFLLITLILVTLLLSILVGYLIYIIKTSKNSNFKYHNMNRLSREDLVNDDVWEETEINSNLNRN